MSPGVLRHCVVCKNWSGLFLVEDPERGKVYYCYKCWRKFVAPQILTQSQPTPPANAIPELLTERLKLRGFTLGDVEAMHTLLNEKDVLRYFPAHDLLTQEKVEKMVARWLLHWREHGYGLWAVERRMDQVLIGRCGLQYLAETDEVEIDFIIGRSYWGMGFATEAGKASLHYGFEGLKLNQIVGISHVDNLASQRVLTKLGMDKVEQRELFGMPCYRFLINT